MILSCRPSARRLPDVECIWYHESAGIGARGRERVLPDGRFQLVLNLSAGTATVSGLRSRHVIIAMASVSHAMGVVFHPAVVSRFFDQPALDFYDRSVPLSLVWGPNASQLVDRLRTETSAGGRLAILEAALVEISGKSDGRRRTLPPAVSYALRAFHHSPRIMSVADVSRDIGWSRRWFSKTFSEFVGMTPKRYCRLLRFQKVVRQVAAGSRVDWADVAMSCGFADQAHLGHEFRAFAGMSPERFLIAERPAPNHVRLD
jgi:AraC-like DNA-binding protein